MVGVLPLAAILIREVAGVPMDYFLTVTAVVAMFGLVVWGSRPSVIAKYGTRSDGVRADVTDAPAGDRDGV